MERSPRSRWRFEPQRDFANKETRRLYQSFIWSVWLLLIVLPPLLVTPIIAGQDTAIEITAAPVAGILIGCIILGIVLARWFLQGFDLRERRTQLEAGTLFLTPVLLYITSWLTGSNDAKVAFAACATVLIITALVAVTFTGPNSTALGVSIAAALSVLLVPGIHSGQLIGIVIWAAVMWFAVKMSVWYIDVVRDLDEARRTAARLAVAEERLRFSADLHDVMGRNLAAISLKAQLADKLLDSDSGRAREQLGEVSALASSSLADVRGLVRGYRDLDLDTEIKGAVSLLESAGAKVTVSGRADALSPEQADHTAAVITEATTNILHHSDAEQVNIELSPTLIRIVNDRARATETTAGGSGLRGLARRVNGTGKLDHRVDGDHFVLELHFQEES